MACTSLTDQGSPSPSGSGSRLLSRCSHQAAPPAERDPAHVLDTTGRAIVLTTLSTMAGFLGLLPAHFAGLRQLGLCGALAVLFCMLAAFLVLPALLALWWPRRD